MVGVGVKGGLRGFCQKLWPSQGSLYCTLHTTSAVLQRPPKEGSYFGRSKPGLPCSRRPFEGVGACSPSRCSMSVGSAFCLQAVFNLQVCTQAESCACMTAPKPESSCCRSIGLLGSGAARTARHALHSVHVSLCIPKTYAAFGKQT